MRLADAVQTNDTYVTRRPPVEPPQKPQIPWEKIGTTIASIVLIILGILFLKVLVFNGDHYGDNYVDTSVIVSKRVEKHTRPNSKGRDREFYDYFVTIRKSDGSVVECTAGVGVYQRVNVGESKNLVLRDYMDKEGHVLETDIYTFR